MVLWQLYVFKSSPVPLRQMDFTRIIQTKQNSGVDEKIIGHTRTLVTNDTIRLSHMEWPAKSFHKPELGLQHQDPGGSPDPLPKCECCGIQVPRWRLKYYHYASESCKLGETWHLRWEPLHRFFEASRISLQINGEPLSSPEAFPYLGKMLAYNNSNLLSILQK